MSEISPDVEATSQSEDDNRPDILTFIRDKAKLAFKDIGILHTMLHEYVPFFAKIRSEAAQTILTDLPEDFEDYEETDQIKKYAVLRGAIHHADRAWTALETLHSAIVAAEGVMFLCQRDYTQDLDDEFRQMMEGGEDLGTPEDGCPF